MVDIVYLNNSWTLKTFLSIWLVCNTNQLKLVAQMWHYSASNQITHIASLTKWNFYELCRFFFYQFPIFGFIFIVFLGFFFLLLWEHKAVEKSLHLVIIVSRFPKIGRIFTNRERIVIIAILHFEWLLFEEIGIIIPDISRWARRMNAWFLLNQRYVFYSEADGGVEIEVSEVFSFWIASNQIWLLEFWNW